jgi:hypothetical protein
MRHRKRGICDISVPTPPSLEHYPADTIPDNDLLERCGRCATLFHRIGRRSVQNAANPAALVLIPDKISDG